MSLPHALLTALAERPCSGSELAVRFDRSIGYFWHATHQQIYRELGRLEESGFIQPLPEAPTRGRKRAYRLLPAGRKELKQWVMEEQEPSGLRDDMMVRLWAEATVGPTRLHEEIRRRLAQHREKLLMYRNFEARDFPEEPKDRAAAIRRTVLQAGIRYETLWIDTLEAALAAIERPTDFSPESVTSGTDSG